MSQPTVDLTAASTASLMAKANMQADLWKEAFKLLHRQECDLMADYRRHLEMDETDADSLPAPEAVEKAVQRLLVQRELKQRISLFGLEINARRSAENLLKVLVWSDGIVTQALSAQPYAALAWSAVSILLPVCC